MGSILISLFIVAILASFGASEDNVKMSTQNPTKEDKAWIEKLIDPNNLAIYYRGSQSRLQNQHSILEDHLIELSKQIAALSTKLARLSHCFNGTGCTCVQNE